MNIVKRDGKIESFNKDKIINAINKAFIEVDKTILDPNIAIKIANVVENKIRDCATVEEIQDKVEEGLMSTKRKDVARAYVRYRQRKEIVRQTNKTYEGILDLVDLKNEEIKDENSNKNAIISSTQRDYVAGEVSKDLTNRFLLPSSVVEAHKNGLIHFHDADYFLQHIHNCCLVNLDDMLQNGTVINKTLIEKPHSFATACNIATQIAAVIASGQYGGQSMSLTHLAPFVDISRQNIRKKVMEELMGLNPTEEQIYNITEKRLKEEIERGVQTMQYQINTLNTSNG